MREPTRRFHLPSALRRSSLRISSEEARERVAAGGLLVDVRRDDDPAPALDGAVRVPPDSIPNRIAGMRPEVAIVLACT